MFTAGGSEPRVALPMSSTHLNDLEANEPNESNVDFSRHFCGRAITNVANQSVHFDPWRHDGEVPRLTV